MRNFFRNLQKLNFEFDDINSGGCGLSALFMHQALTSKGVNTQIAVINNWRDNKEFSVNEAFINIANGVPITCYDEAIHHIVLVLDNGTIFDSDGPSKRWDLCTERVELEVLAQLVANKGVWNSEFKNSNDWCGDVEVAFCIAINKIVDESF